jgi:acetyltransferase-like isoleucine patch superfamily enzyme
MNAAPRLTHDWFPRDLPANVVLGPRSWCYSSFAFLHYQSRRPRGVSVGHDSGIYHGTFFDLGPDGEVSIGNFCTLVGPIITSNSRVFIGDYVFIAHEVVLADSFAALPSAESDGTALEGNLSTRGANIEIGDNCWIGARAVLTCGARLGAGVVVGAAALVDFKVPPYAVVAGNPARIVGWTDGRGD